MNRCPACDRPVSGRFCPSCGAEPVATTQQSPAPDPTSRIPGAPGATPGGTVQPGYVNAPPPNPGAPVAPGPVGPPVQPATGNRSTATAALIGGLSVAVVAALIAIVALLVTRSGEDDTAGVRTGGGGGATTSVITGSAQGQDRASQPTTPNVAEPAPQALPPPPTTVPPILVSAVPYLERSAAGRAAVQDGVAACRNGDVTGALSGLQEGKVNRQQILDGLAGVNIAGFESLFLDMQDAMRLSIEADDLYQQWVQSTDCFYDLDSNFYLDRADEKSGDATAAKERFVASWNPIARQYGLRQFDAGQI